MLCCHTYTRCPEGHTHASPCTGHTSDRWLRDGTGTVRSAGHTRREMHRKRRTYTPRTGRPTRSGYRGNQQRTCTEHKHIIRPLVKNDYDLTRVQHCRAKRALIFNTLLTDSAMQVTTSFRKKNSPFTVFSLVAFRTGGAAVVIKTLCLTGGTKAERNTELPQLKCVCVCVCVCVCLCVRE